MTIHMSSNGLIGLAALTVLIASGPGLANPVAVPPPPRPFGPAIYGQSFYWGVPQFPAGGYSGGVYRPTAYSAADIYVNAPMWGARRAGRACTMR